jgi:cytochrome c-type biogenesis protein
MAENVSFLIAFVAGVISFLSPCILPVIPSFLSFLGGISYSELREHGVSRAILFVKTLFFVVGFSIIFVALGVVFSSAGLALSGAQRIINWVAGSIVVVFGLNFIFDFWKMLNIEKRLHLQKMRRGVLGAVLLGMAFGAGWTPCVGPILASILFLAGSAGNLLHGTVLLAVYSLGLGVPFLLAGVFFSSFHRQVERIKPHLRTIKVASGIFLVSLGVLIFTGSLARLNTTLFSLAARIDQWEQQNPFGPRLLFGGLFLFLTLFCVVLYVRRVLKSMRNEGLSFHSFLYPLHGILVLAFASLSILSFSDGFNLPRLLSSWLRFQGI